MDPLIALLVVVLSVLTILLVVVFVYVIMILRQFRETLDHLNNTLENTDSLLKALSHPFKGIGGALVGLKTGLQVAETFVQWLHEHKGVDNGQRLHDR